MNNQECTNQMVFVLGIAQSILKTRLIDILVAAGPTGLSLCTFQREDTQEEVVFTATSMAELLESVNNWVFTIVEAGVGGVRGLLQNSLLSKLIVMGKF